MSDANLNLFCSAFDEMSLVYEKAEGNPILNNWLDQLEEKALEEARKIFIAASGGQPQTGFDDLLPGLKSRTIVRTAQQGLSVFNVDIQNKKIIVELSPGIQGALGCTFFDILNRIEKLDGSLNELIGDFEMEVQAPLGGKKGLTEMYMMIQMLYPWIKGVHETSTNQMAVDLYEFTEATFAQSNKTPAKSPAPAPDPDYTFVVSHDFSTPISTPDPVLYDRPEPVSHHKPQKSAAQKPEKKEKKSFLQRLFGR